MEQMENIDISRLGREYREAVYATIQAALAVAATRKDFEVIVAQCESIAGYRDVDDILRDARLKMESLTGQPDLDEVIAHRVRLRTKRNKVIYLALAVLAVAGALVATVTVVQRLTACNTHYSAAKVERDELLKRKVEAGQGFAEKLQVIAAKWEEAEAARQGQRWGQAMSRYDEVLSLARTIEALEQKRETARLARDEMVKARTSAAALEAEQDASGLWTRAMAQETAAKSAFEGGQFDEATAGWKGAGSGYRTAGNQARAVQQWLAAKQAYAQDLTKNEALLTAYGGGEWMAVKQDAILGEATGTDPAERLKAYQRAREGLPVAVIAARENERKAKIATALSVAKTAREGGRWEECLTQAEMVLVLDSGQAEALALKKQAEGQMIPTLKVVAVAEGREVSATVTDGGSGRWTTPVTIQLVSDKTCALEVTYAGTGTKSWKSVAIQRTANWRGEREERVVLEEIKGPVPGVSLALDLGGGVKLEMVWIPSGEFEMGSKEYNLYKPVHPVRVSKGFWLGKYELTQKQWEQVMLSDAKSASSGENNPSKFRGPMNPVEQVSWNDCQKFLDKLNNMTTNNHLPKGMVFRLPTEAEWEYACRAGTKTRFYSGDADLDLDRVGWYDGNSGRQTHPVGQKAPNQFGLYDMHGNVWEWCQDWCGKYSSGEETDPTGPSIGEFRMFRGGGWFDSVDNNQVATRGNRGPKYAYDFVGFRVAASASIKSVPAPAQPVAVQPAGEAGKSMTVDLGGGVQMEYVWIQALKIWVGKYEVTNGEYRKYKPEHDSKAYKGHSLNGDRQPVLLHKFIEADEFAKWLTQRERDAGRLPEGSRYRRPSKAEWMAFAQCGDGRVYPWGNDWPPKYGNYCGQETLRFAGTMIDQYNDGSDVTCDVEKSGKNDWGLYGVGGNAWEVCSDGFCGASWGNARQSDLRCEARYDNGLPCQGYDLGFRLLLEAVPLAAPAPTMSTGEAGKTLGEETPERQQVAEDAANTNTSKLEYSKLREIFTELSALNKELRPLEKKVRAESAEFNALGEKEHAVVPRLGVNEWRDLTDRKLSEDPKLAPLVARRRELLQTIKEMRQNKRVAEERRLVEAKQAAEERRLVEAKQAEEGRRLVGNRAADMDSDHQYTEAAEKVHLSSGDAVIQGVTIVVYYDQTGRALAQTLFDSLVAKGMKPGKVESGLGAGGAKVIVSREDKAAAAAWIGKHVESLGDYRIVASDSVHGGGDAVYINMR